VTFGVTLARNCITHSPNNSLLLPRALDPHKRHLHHNSFLIDPQTKVLISLFANSGERTAFIAN
jgi:hypothetical protein